MANKISMKTNGNIWEVVLDGNPATTGFTAPIGSLAIDQTNGEEYYKYGSGDNDWKSNATDDELATEIANRTNEYLTFLKLDGSRPMTGDLDLNSNNIQNVNYEQFIETSSTPTPPTTGLKSFSKKIGLRNMLAVVGKSGLDYTLQPHIGRNKTMLWQANGNATSSTIIGGVATGTGTVTARNVANTNLFTSMRRLGYVSSATAGSSSGLRTSALQYWRGNASDRGGFHFICRFGISDASAVATGRLFVGLTSSTGVIPNVNPSTLLNIIGVGADNTDTNLQIMRNDNSGTATKIDLGSSFPANTS